MAQKSDLAWAARHVLEKRLFGEVYLGKTGVRSGTIVNLGNLKGGVDWGAEGHQQVYLQSEHNRDEAVTRFQPDTDFIASCDQSESDFWAEAFRHELCQIGYLKHSNIK